MRGGQASEETREASCVRKVYRVENVHIRPMLRPGLKKRRGGCRGHCLSWDQGGGLSVGPLGARRGKGKSILGDKLKVYSQPFKIKIEKPDTQFKYNQYLKNHLP